MRECDAERFFTVLNADTAVVCFYEFLNIVRNGSRREYLSVYPVGNFRLLHYAHDVIENMAKIRCNYDGKRGNWELLICVRAKVSQLVVETADERDAKK